ncbi:MAG: phospholipase, partial [Chitinophagaceae bacterium]
ATNNTWYPYSFMALPEENEPWLSSALTLLREILDEILSLGVATKNIYFLGFSQGSCLTLEFISRNPDRYGGVIAFTGGLIGDKIYAKNYNGDFNRTPIFIGTSNPDAHVPVERVYDTERILKELNAEVTVKIYKGMGHTITKDEIDDAIDAVFADR